MDEPTREEASTEPVDPAPRSSRFEDGWRRLLRGRAASGSPGALSAGSCWESRSRRLSSFCGEAHSKASRRWLRDSSECVRTV